MKNAVSLELVDDIHKQVHVVLRILLVLIIRKSNLLIKAQLKALDQI